MSALDLARLVLEVLDAQKAYFKTRGKEELIKSKQLEAKLKKAAEAVIEADRAEII